MGGTGRAGTHCTGSATNLGQMSNSSKEPDRPQAGSGEKPWGHTASLQAGLTSSSLLAIRNIRAWMSFQRLSAHVEYSVELH